MNTIIIPAGHARECVRWISATYAGTAGHYTPGRGTHAAIAVVGSPVGAKLPDVAFHAQLRWG